jgi:hypothetical protein
MEPTNQVQEPQEAGHRNPSPQHFLTSHPLHAGLNAPPAAPQASTSRVAREPQNMVSVR